MDIEDMLYPVLVIVGSVFLTAFLFAPIVNFIAGFVVLNALIRFVLTLTVATILLGVVTTALKLPKELFGVATGSVFAYLLWDFAAGIPYGQLVVLIGVVLVGMAAIRKLIE